MSTTNLSCNESIKRVTYDVLDLTFSGLCNGLEFSLHREGNSCFNGLGVFGHLNGAHINGLFLRGVERRVNLQKTVRDYLDFVSATSGDDVPPLRDCRLSDTDCAGSLAH